MPPIKMCKRCVLTTSVPRVTLDGEEVCNVCREYEANRSVADRFFKTEDDLRSLLEDSRNPQAEYDVVLMYSGGKDSTYMLYRMVDFGCRVLALTFDNGYVPRGCFDNIRGVCDDLGVKSVVVSLPKSNMDRAFARELAVNSTVCYACYRALTARGTELAIRENIPVVMTGLSRGQIYDTKVHPLVSEGITDPEQIDDYLRRFREMYHSVRNEIGELVGDRAMADPAAFRRTRFVDFYRYCAVSKKEIMALIGQRAPFWRKPENVGGCSSNCTMNNVGIYVHLANKGYHNYAQPTAWEVRFGHLTREEAIDELAPPPNEPHLRSMLAELKVSVDDQDNRPGV